MPTQFATERLDATCSRAPIGSASDAHRGQKRHSGEPFVIALRRGRQDPRRPAARLGDGRERADPRRRRGHGASRSADVEREFGKEIARHRRRPDQDRASCRLRLERRSGRSRTTASCCCRSRRTRASSSIKLADRLHNMRTLDSLPEEKRRRIAQETRDLYAPLAHRFGMAKMRWELEDLAFKHLETDGIQGAGEEGRAEARRARGADRADARAARARADATPGSRTSRSPAGRSISGRSTRR